MSRKKTRKIVGPPDPRRSAFYNKPRDPRKIYVFKTTKEPGVILVSVSSRTGETQRFHIPLQGIPHWARNIYRCMKWAQERPGHVEVPGVGYIHYDTFCVLRG